MATYDELLERLRHVPPFKPLSPQTQAVPRLSAIIHPLFVSLGLSWLTPIMQLKDRLTYKEFIIQGAEHLPQYPSEPVIFVANHLSYLDPPMIGFVIQRFHGYPPWFMAKKKLWDRLNYRLTFSMLGALPYIRRGVNIEKHVENLKSFTSILKARQPLVIFPEGTIPGEIEFGRSGFCKLRSDVEAATGLLKAGALVPLLALVSGAKVIPVGTSGTGQILPPEVEPGNLGPAPRKKEFPVKITFGAPIDVTNDFKAHPHDITEDELIAYANTRIMPALSRLIDFSLHQVPVIPPLKAEDYAKIREFESRIADEYRAKGKLNHAALLLKQPLQEAPTN